MMPRAARSGPRLGRILLRVIAAPADRDAVVDDLEEWYRRRHGERGRLRADIWYIAQVCRSVVPLGWERLRGHRPLDWSKKMEDLWQDIRYGFRVATHAPLPTAATVITLALGLGFAAAMASAVWSTLLRPLPIPESGGVVTIAFSLPESTRPLPLSYQDFDDWTKSARSFVAFGAYDGANATLISANGPLPLSVGTVGDGFWRVLGASPALGRLLAPEDFATGAAPVVVLTHQFWTQQFHADPGLIGRTIQLDDGAVTVVGVLRQDAFAFPSTGLDLYRPLRVATSGPDSWQSQRGSHWLNAIARIRPGVSIAAATTELRTLDAGIAREYNRRGDMGKLVLTPLQESLVGNVRATLTLLAAIAGMVLLIGVANVASIRLTQAQGRRREFGMRLVLGAGMRRLMRQVLTESLALSIAGAAIGLLIADPILRAMVALYPGALPSTAHRHIGAPILAAMLLVAVAAGVAFAMPQLLQLRREDIGRAARMGERSGGGRISDRMRKALVIFQLAASVMLLVGSGLLLRTFWNLTRVAPGFNRSGVLTFSVAAAPARHSTPEETQLFYEQVQAGIKALPGVQRVGSSNAVPLAGNPWRDGIPRPGAQERHAGMNIRLVSADYLQTLEVPLRSGRLFTPADRDGSMLVAVVNAALAQELYPGENPVGRTVPFNKQERTIVGVVDNLHQTSLSAPFDPELYIPFEQSPLKRNRLFAVRVSGDESAVLAGVRRVVNNLDAEVAVRNINTLDDLVTKSIAPQRFRGTLMGGLAALALVLATIGLYGVTSYTVSQRTREFGIRLALGQTPSGLSRGVVREALVLSLIGIAVGVGAALLAVRALSELVFGVTTTDPVTLVGVPVLLGLVTIFAASGPARRAGRVDPLRAIQG